MIQNRISLLATEDSKIMRKIDETRRLAQKIQKAKEQKDREMQDALVIDEEKHREVVVKKMKVIEDRKSKLAASENRLKNMVENVQKETLKRRE